ncbi:MAG: 5-(carboxyamino)imidazole ribonucleotide synthase, partial [Pseudomonadota bacterium]
MTTKGAPLPTGAVIGILGGGQLGRMLAVAASRLGYRAHIYCPDPQSPAFEVAAEKTCAAYEDWDALAGFARTIDVLTFEFENIPVETVWQLETLVPVHPSGAVLYATQDRRTERILLSDLGIPASPFGSIDGPEAIPAVLDHIGGDGIMKTRKLGYDGKGQTRVRAGDNPQAAWAAIGGSRAILEAVIPFEREVSVVIARTMAGATAAYPAVHNTHANHILARTMAPADISADLAHSAQQIAARIADALDHVGILAVEMFVVAPKDGPPSLIVNEMAPRVHNSGHWTQDGAVTDQVEQHIRAITGLPLGSAAMCVPRAQMTNIIGEAGADGPYCADVAARNGGRLHL